MAEGTPFNMFGPEVEVEGFTELAVREAALLMETTINSILEDIQSAATNSRVLKEGSSYSWIKDVMLAAVENLETMLHMIDQQYKAYLTSRNQEAAQLVGRRWVTMYGYGNHIDTCNKAYEGKLI